MEQSFWDKIKRVKLSDLAHLFKLLLAILPAVSLRKKRPNLWLLCDSRYEAGDNAYWLFRYVVKNHPEQDVAFALDKASRDYEKVAALGQIVPYGSVKHWIYYLAAKINISSHKMGKPNAALCYVLEVYGILKNTRVFLQHGIITADLTFLHYPNTKMSLFTTSTQAEWQYINDSYEYPQGIVQKLGLCRFDNLHDFTVKPRQLLIMPTWRMYIRNQLAGAGESRLAQFQKTQYYTGWNDFLSHPRFLQFVKENNLSVVFCPHREMMPFLDAFRLDDAITLETFETCDVQELLKDSAFLITDYSSVSLDFAYMKKPLAYYQFDYGQFRQSHHPEGYFSYTQDGFGPVCSCADELLQALETRFSPGAGFTSDPAYRSRSDKFFDLWDRDNCKRTFDAITKL